MGIVVGILMPISGRCVRVLNVQLSDTAAGMSILSFRHKATAITLIEVSDDIQPLDIQLVGRYALQFSWNDGHATGIYPFEVLREICPCPECSPLSPIQPEEEN